MKPSHLAKDKRVGDRLSWASRGWKVWAPEHDGDEARTTFFPAEVVAAHGDHVHVRALKGERERLVEVRACFAWVDP